MDKYTAFETIALLHVAITVGFFYVCSAYYTTLAHNLSDKALMAVEHLTTFLWFVLALSGISITAILFYYGYHIALGIVHGLGSCMLYMIAFAAMVCSGPTHYKAWNSLNEEDNENGN